MQNKNTKETKKIDLHPKKCNICGGLVSTQTTTLFTGNRMEAGNVICVRSVEVTLEHMSQDQLKH